TAPTVKGVVVPSANVTGTVLPTRQLLSSASVLTNASWRMPTLDNEPDVTSGSRTFVSCDGSATRAVWESLPNFTNPSPMPTAVCTSGSRATSSASRGLRLARPKPPVPMTRSPPNEREMLRSVDALIDEPNVVNNVTTATPTNNAAAVADVRRGLRVALPRASEPVAPRNRATGVPRAEPMGPATAGPNTTTPTIVRRAPNPARANVPLPLLSTATSTMATPTAPMANPTTTRAGDTRGVSAPASRRAATGRTRDERTAGAAPATSVTTTPTRSPMMIVDTPNTSPPAGRATDSSGAETSTWRRVAPTARSNADAVLRWVPMIEKVL